MLLTPLLGCRARRPQNAPGGPLVVPVAKPAQREVTDFVDFTGRTNAVTSVKVVAQVTGYLLKIPFTEGAEVKAGDTLFELDPQVYDAQLKMNEAQVKLNEAKLELATKNFDRALELEKKKSITAAEFDQAKADKFTADAQLKSSQASVDLARLNLHYTKVTSPISGKTSSYFVKVGNLVIQNQTLLTTVMTLDPIHVDFDVDEPTLQRIKKAVNEGKMKSLLSGKVPVLLGVQGEKGFLHKGTIDFINNTVNPTTGSIAVRGLFDNPKVPKLGRLLLPGMFVRVRLTIGEPYPGLLVIDRAINFDQTLKYVYVVDADKKVQVRRVTTGPLQEDGLRVITKGLQPEDLVVVGSQQQIKPGQTVGIDAKDMESLSPTIDAAK
jgi:multidrug efflux system membrane fusion protein